MDSLGHYRFCNIYSQIQVLLMNLRHVSLRNPLSPQGSESYLLHPQYPLVSSLWFIFYHRPPLNLCIYSVWPLFCFPLPPLPYLSSSYTVYYPTSYNVRLSSKYMVLWAPAADFRAGPHFAYHPWLPNSQTLQSGDWMLKKHTYGSRAWIKGDKI